MTRFSQFEHHYNTVLRAQRSGRVASARDVLRLLGLLCLIASGAFWYPLQWWLVGPTMPAEMVIAAAFGTFIVLGPPVFVSFFVPWSPAAQLLMKLNFKTAGQSAALAAMLYLVYYAAQLLLLFWAARPNTAESGLITQQMILGLICTILTPALLWAPTSNEELEEILKQDQLVRRYELQTQADLLILKGMVLDAQRIATVGWAQAMVELGGPQAMTERMHYLLSTLDQSHGEIAHLIESISGVQARFPSVNPAERDDIAGVLDFAGNLFQQYADDPAARYLPATTGETIDLSHAAAHAIAPASARESTPPAATAGSPPRAVPRETLLTPDDTADLEAYGLALDRLGFNAWMRRDLQAVLGCEQTKALDMIRGWIDGGWVKKLNTPKDHYCFTEPAARSGGAA